MGGTVSYKMGWQNRSIAESSTDIKFSFPNANYVKKENKNKSYEGKKREKIPLLWRRNNLTVEMELYFEMDLMLPFLFVLLILLGTPNMIIL